MASHDQTGALLPREFSAQFTMESGHLASYLEAVEGGHPVHTSLDVATAAGFKGIPLPGVQLVGAALAACTRQLGSSPIQLLQIESKFRRPVYLGDHVELRVSEATRQTSADGIYVTVVYEGEGFLQDRKSVFSIRFHLRARN